MFAVCFKLHQGVSCTDGSSEKRPQEVLVNGSGVSLGSPCSGRDQRLPAPGEETPATLSPARAWPKLPSLQRPSFLSRLHPKICHPFSLLETPQAGTDPGMAPTSSCTTGPSSLPDLYSNPPPPSFPSLAGCTHLTTTTSASLSCSPSCPPLLSLPQPRGSLLGGAVRGPWELSPHLHPSSCSHDNSPLLLPEAGPCHRSQPDTAAPATS